MHAFARLYGVVRWFHPSDAASVIDWDRFAIDGAHRTADAADREALRARLSELFFPIAPTVHIVNAGEPVPDEPSLHPRSIDGLDLVSWQHEGYGDSTIGVGGYASKRRHRPRIVPVSGTPFLALVQFVDATPYRGMPIRLRGSLRAANHGKARMWLRVDRGEVAGFFDNMLKRPVTSGSWVQGEITGTVDQDATRIAVGVLVLGTGTTWYDNLELSVQTTDQSWERIDIRNGSFEGSTFLDTWRPGTGRRGSSDSMDGWQVTLDHSLPASGSSSLRVEPATRTVTEELFDEMPRMGEAVDVDLGSGLRARVPISLYSRAGRTIGDDPEAARRSQASPPASPAGFDVLAGAADVIVVWNVFEHFWTYWDLAVGVDWMAALDRALADALDDRSVADHVATLERLTTGTADGHIGMRCLGETEVAFLPVATDLVEGRVVVTASKDKSIEIGDVLLTIDGQAAGQLLAEEESRVSGSPQWRHLRGLRRLGRGTRGSRVPVVIDRGGARLEASVVRVDQPFVPEPSHRAIERFDDGVYYVDLSQASMQELDAAMNRLAAAPGVVFDVRERPNSGEAILSHLLTHPDSANWMAVPRIIRPDSPSSPAAWATSGWQLPVLTPHIQGRIAFLTGPSTISYPESIMGLVEYYRLGEIVGAATAGSNGDIAQISAPTGCEMIFTGRRVTKPDGSRHYLVGTQPTIPAAPTVAGIRARRDEVLEAALAYVRRDQHR